MASHAPATPSDPDPAAEPRPDESADSLKALPEAALSSNSPAALPTPAMPKAPARGPAAPPPPAIPLPPIVLTHPETIKTTLRLLFDPDQVFEVRILDGVPNQGWNKPRTFAGYFHGSDGVELVAALGQFKSWSAAYVTLNRIDPVMYARAASRLTDAKSTAGDDDVLDRRLLLLDFDPVRRSGISSTTAEHSAALDLAQEAQKFLSEAFGWPAPVRSSSGNGAHLVYRIDLPRDDDIVERLLRSADALFSTDAVKVDTSVFNPARISKLYGTLTCKGDSIAERPHRIAAILEAPEVLAVVCREQLEAVAQSTGHDEAAESATASRAPQSPHAGASKHREPFDVRAFLSRNGIEVHRECPWVGGTKWVLARCPMDPTHAVDLGTFVGQLPSGAIVAKCQHERCHWEWRELRERFEPKPLDASGRGHSGAGQASDGRAATVATGNGTAATREFRIGDSVRPHDRDNYGTVVGVNGENFDVHFVSEDGNEATVSFHATELTLASKNGKRARQRESKQYTILGIPEILNTKFPEYLVRGVFDLGNLVVLYGEPATFKSFVGIDLGLRVAAGISWHDPAHLARESVVLYVMAEGQFGLRLRVGAWLKSVQPAIGSTEPFDLAAFHTYMAERFFAIADDVPLFNENEPEVFIAAIETLAVRTGQKPSLIILDTLARCFIGGDENSSEDMGTFIEACDILRKRTGAAVMLIHHTGKDGELERGSSALRAGADCMIKATREDHTGDAVGRVRLVVEKRKDGPHPTDMLLDMWKVDIGKDADGEPLTSLIPMRSAASSDQDGNGKRKSWRKNTAQQQHLDILQSLVTTFERGGASAGNLLSDTGVKRSSFYKRVKELEDIGYVELDATKRHAVYRATTSGREKLSRESPESQSTGDREGRPRVSEVSPTPLKGGGDEPETETRTEQEIEGEPQ